MDTERRTVTARQRWRLLHANTKAAARRRDSLDAKFETFFPRGHDESLRFIARTCASKGFESLTPADLFRHLGDIHPEAFELLDRYGVDYVPKVLDARFTRKSDQPMRNGCFRNSALILHSFGSQSREDRMDYVEGIAFGADVWPMLHAWNVDAREGMVFDWTFYPSVRWTRYFGIPFTLEEHTLLCESANPGSNVASFLHREMFPRCSERLHILLEKREPYQEKPAA